MNGDNACMNSVIRATSKSYIEIVESHGGDVHMSYEQCYQDHLQVFLSVG